MQRWFQFHGCNWSHPWSHLTSLSFSLSCCSLGCWHQHSEAGSTLQEQWEMLKHDKAKKLRKVTCKTAAAWLLRFYLLSSTQKCSLKRSIKFVVHTLEIYQLFDSSICKQIKPQTEWTWSNLHSSWLSHNWTTPWHWQLHGGDFHGGAALFLWWWPWGFPGPHRAWWPWCCGPNESPGFAQCMWSVHWYLHWRCGQHGVGEEKQIKSSLARVVEFSLIFL